LVLPGGAGRRNGPSGGKPRKLQRTLIDEGRAECCGGMRRHRERKNTSSTGTRNPGTPLCFIKEVLNEGKSTIYIEQWEQKHTDTPPPEEEIPRLDPDPEQ